VLGDPDQAMVPVNWLVEVIDVTGLWPKTGTMTPLIVDVVIVAFGVTLTDPEARLSPTALIALREML